MASEKVVERAKKLTAIGAAVIMCAALVGMAWTAATRTYLFAQRVEVYVGLPEWLGKVEKKVDVVVEKVDVVAQEQKATNQRLDSWMRAESRRRSAATSHGGR